MTCPFTQEKLAAVPALRPTVAIIHAQQADRDGNVRFWGITGVQKEAVLAAQHSIVTVEEIVDRFENDRNATILPSWTVSAVVHAPRRLSPFVRGRLLAARQRLLRSVGLDQSRSRQLRTVAGGIHLRARTAVSPDRFSTDEMMTVAAARELAGCASCFVGIGLPSTAANLARSHHAKGLVLVYESGTIGAKPTPLTPVDRRRRVGGDGGPCGVSPRNIQLLATTRTHRRWHARRSPDRQIRQSQLHRDRCVRRTRGRLPGSGGAPEIAAACPRVIVVMRQSTKVLCRRSRLSHHRRIRRWRWRADQTGPARGRPADSHY